MLRRTDQRSIINVTDENWVKVNRKRKAHENFDDIVGRIIEKYEEVKGPI